MELLVTADAGSGSLIRRGRTALTIYRDWNYMLGDIFLGVGTAFNYTQRNFPTIKLEFA